MLSLTHTHSLCETEGIEFNAVIIPTDVDRSLKFLQIKQKAAGNPAAFRCFWVYKIDRFHSESVNFFVSQNHTLDVWSGKNYIVARKKGNKKLLVAG